MKTEAPHALENPQNQIILSSVHVYVSVLSLIKLPISTAVDKIRSEIVNDTFCKISIYSYFSL
jgi:hypothetical protein